MRRRTEWPFARENQVSSKACRVGGSQRASSGLKGDGGLGAAPGSLGLGGIFCNDTEGGRGGDIVGCSQRRSNGAVMAMPLLGVGLCNSALRLRRGADAWDATGRRHFCSGTHWASSNEKAKGLDTPLIYKKGRRKARWEGTLDRFYSSKRKRIRVDLFSGSGKQN